MNTAVTGWHQIIGQGHDWIADRIPHQGRMCLLDGVLEADSERMVCSARNHHDSTHPMRTNNRLGSACGIEYAAQAMALHGAVLAHLQGHGGPDAGYLVSVRELRLSVRRLDDVIGALRIAVERLAAGGQNCAYTFELHEDNGPLLLQGRAHVVLKTSGT